MTEERYSTSSDHDLLVRIDERVIILDRRLSEERLEALKLIGDLQSRVKATEDAIQDMKEFRANLMGKLAIGGALVAIVGSLLSRFIYDRLFI